MILVITESNFDVKGFNPIKYYIYLSTPFLKCLKIIGNKTYSNCYYSDSVPAFDITSETIQVAEYKQRYVGDIYCPPH